MTSLRFRKRSEYYCPAERLKGSGDELFIVHTLSSTDGLTETCAQKRLFFSLPLFIVLCISRYRNRSGLKRDKRDRKSNKNMYMKYFAVMLCLGNLNVGNYVINMQWQEEQNCSPQTPPYGLLCQNHGRFCCDLMKRAVRLYLRYSFKNVAAMKIVELYMTERGLG